MSNSTNWRRANTLQQKEQTLYPRTYNPTRKGTKQQNTQRASKEQQQQTGSTKQINRKNKLKLRVWGDSFMGPVRMNGAQTKNRKTKRSTAKGEGKAVAKNVQECYMYEEQRVAVPAMNFV